MPAKPKQETSTAPATLPAALAAALTANSGVALRLPGADEAGAFTYEQLAAAANEVARGLAALGIEVGDRVAILSSTRPEWTLADVGALLAGAVVVPIYFTNSPEECEYVLAHSGTKVVLCEDAEQLAKVEKVAARCRDLETRILLTGEAKGALTLAELRAKGRATDDPQLLDQRRAAVKPADVATIVYTSGTTGPPKGCMLTHANILAATTMYGERLDLNSSMSIYMYLPLAHALARIAQMVALTVGGTIVFWRGDAKKIIDELAEAKPTHFPSVPRVFEKVHARILAGVADAKPVRRAMFNWAVAEGTRHSKRGGRSAGPLARRRHALADKLVLSKVRAAFGGNIQMALTGAAPIGQEILEFFDACGLLVLEGYGLTETCAASTINTVREHRFGSIGRPLPGSDVAVGEDGELRLRGPQVFAGYYREPEATQAALDGAWLQTGDLGEVDADGYVRITGRKKDLIITSSGKNISPSNIEEQLRESRFISQAVVFGDRRSYLVALVTLDADEAAALAERVGSGDDDLAALSEHPGVKAELQQAVDGVNARLARIEQVKRFAILDHDLSQESGELTPTLKIKRPVVAERYGKLVEELYGG
jgi:long-chain acyl-CoA synthetase